MAKEYCVTCGKPLNWFNFINIWKGGKLVARQHIRCMVEERKTQCSKSCSWCDKVIGEINGKGTGALISHGICPSCFEEYRDKKKDDKPLDKTPGLVQGYQRIRQ